MITTKQIKRDGNSHKISIDKTIMGMLGLKEGDYIEIFITKTHNR